MSNHKNCLICKESLIEHSIFTCTKCKISYHQKCSYYTEEEIKKYSITMCDVCRTCEAQCEESSEKFIKKIKCFFCHKKDGVLRNLYLKQQKKWTHFNCMRWFRFIKLKRENGQAIFISDQDIDEKTWLEDCKSCKKTICGGDFLIKCSKKLCEKYFHSKCASTQSTQETILDNFIYKILHCEEHSLKKDHLNIKTYGKNINTNINKAESHIKTVDSYNHEKEDIILEYHRPCIIEEENGNKLKIKMKLEEMPIEEIRQKIMSEASGSLLNKKKLRSDDNEVYDFVKTSQKCDICNTHMDECDNIIQCKNCLIYTHTSCSNRIFKINKSNVCDKCSIGNEDQCIICNKNLGSMVKCDKTWVHILCKSYFSKYFNQKYNSDNEYTYEKRKIKNEKKDKCILCRKKGDHLIKCDICKINFHPYCGYSYDLNFGIKNGIIWNICDNHKFYRNRVYMSNSDKNTQSSTVKIEIPQEHRIKRTRCFNKKQIDKKVGIKVFHTKNIQSINFRKLRNIYFKERYKKNKENEIGWEYFDEYFNIKQEEIESLEPGIFTNQEKTESLIANLEISEDLKNIRSSLVSFKDSQYITYFDYSEFKQDKTEANFVNLCKTLINEDSEKENFSFISNKYLNDGINLYDVDMKLFEDDNLNKFKIEFNDKTNDEEKITSTKGIEKKLNLINFYKIEDEKIEPLISSAIKRVCNNLRDTRNLSLSNLYKIDSEILITNNLLELTIINNNQIANNLKKYINDYYESSSYKFLNSQYLFKIYRSVTIYGHIKRRIKMGCSDKNIDDLINSRGQNFKVGKTIVRGKTEYTEFIKSIDSKVLENESDCCVCMYYDYDDISTIVFCDSCNVAFHPECYGISSIPEGEYYCNPCSLKKEYIKCILCKRTKGAFKKIKDDHWAHVFCIILSQNLFFSNYERMENIKGNYDIHCEDVCKVCGEIGGEIFNCETCQHNCRYHVLCAFLHGCRIDIKEKTFTFEDYPVYNKLYPAIICNNDISQNRKIRELTYYKEPKKDERSSLEELINKYLDFENIIYINKQNIENVLSYNNLTVEPGNLNGFGCCICNNSYDKLNENNYCDYCNNIVTKLIEFKQAMCIICNSIGGAVIRIKKKITRKTVYKYWVHHKCLMGIDQENIKFNSYDNKFCENCGKNDVFLLKCTVKDCEFYFHHNCTVYNAKEDKPNKYYCNVHSNLWNLCNKDDIIDRFNKLDKIDSQLLLELKKLIELKEYKSLFLQLIRLKLIP